MLKIKNIFYVLLILFFFAQFFKPEENITNNKTVDAFVKDTNMPEPVRVILEDACFNCHTAQTQYPWYNNITPINYWISRDIKAAKKHFNMSHWAGNSVKIKDAKFKAIIALVNANKMPLPLYKVMHKEAQLTHKQIEAITHWANLVRLKYSMQDLPQ